MKKRESATLWVPVTYLGGIWRGTFKELPPNETYELLIDYPLANPARFNIKTGKNGLNLVALLGKIGKCYEEVYNEEDRYGIWGHDIGDLSIQGIDVNHVKKTIKLSMGS